LVHRVHVLKQLSLAGSYCNSASACFVASDGKNLRLYQAVVDARKLLDELSDPDTSVSGRHGGNHSSHAEEGLNIGERFTSC